MEIGCVQHPEIICSSSLIFGSYLRSSRFVKLINTTLLLLSSLCKHETALSALFKYFNDTVGQVVVALMVFDQHRFSEVTRRKLHALPGILTMKDCLPVEVLMALYSSGMWGRLEFWSVMINIMVSKRVCLLF